MSASSPETQAVRQYERYSAYRDLSIVYEGHSERISVRTPDFSPKGMFIHTPHYFPQGTVLKLTFLLGRSGHEVNVRGEVRYCLDGVGVGVEFVEIQPDDKTAIEDELGIPQSER